MNRLFSIAEETLFFKAEEIDEKIMFIRKVTLRLLWNHKNTLALSLD